MPKMFSKRECSRSTSAAGTHRERECTSNEKSIQVSTGRLPMIWKQCGPLPRSSISLRLALVLEGAPCNMRDWPPTWRRLLEQRFRPTNTHLASTSEEKGPSFYPRTSLKSLKACLVLTIDARRHLTSTCSTHEIRIVKAHGSMK